MMRLTSPQVFRSLAAAAARHCSTAALQQGDIIITCVQVMVSRLYRDLRLGSIAGGADEIMLGIICKLAEMGPTKN